MDVLPALEASSPLMVLYRRYHHVVVGSGLQVEVEVEFFR